MQDLLPNLKFAHTEPCPDSAQNW